MADKADADFSEYLKTDTFSRSEGKESWNKGDVAETFDNAKGSLIHGIIKNVFPQYLKGTAVKITTEKPEDYNTKASYSFMGNKISAGKIKERITTITTAKGKQWTVGAESDDIIDGLGIMLHELYHSKIAAHGVNNFAGATLGKDWKNMLKDARESGFPSVGEGIGGGDNIEEFLATAVPVTQMRAMGMTPKGVFKDIPAKLDVIHKKYPWLKDFINQYADPEKANQKAVNLESTNSSLLDALFGNTKK